MTTTNKKSGTLFNIEKTRKLMDKLKKGNSRQERSAAIDLAETQMHAMADQKPKFLTSQAANKIISELQTENKGLRAQLTASRSLAAKNKAKPSGSTPTANKPQSASPKAWEPAGRPELSRSGFRALTLRQRSEFLKAEGKII